jgi:hypothetical protein
MARATRPGFHDIAYGVAVDSLDQVVMVGIRRGDDGDDDFFMRKLTP